MKITVEKVQFTGDEIAEVRLARIVAELVRQGLTFEVTEDVTTYVIYLQGGF